MTKEELREIGYELYEKYNSDVEEALKPVTEKWKKMKGEIT